MPHYGAAKWDDEGVVTTAAPLIANGMLVDYCGTRFTRQALVAQASRTSPAGSALASSVPPSFPSVASSPGTSPGTATALDVQRPVSGLPASTAVAAAATGPSLDALVRTIRNGYLVREAGFVVTDQQCAGGTIHPDMLLEVRNGKILRRITNAHVAFTTKKLWAAVTAVGDTSTLRTVGSEEMDGPPWNYMTRAITAPAVHVHQADIVLSTGGRL
jgi:predicted Zn-dependent protease